MSVSTDEPYIGHFSTPYIDFRHGAEIKRFILRMIASPVVS